MDVFICADFNIHKYHPLFLTVDLFYAKLFYVGM
ncbi:hypothetical protein J596_4494, partial [Acinetobacter baumannii 21072]